MKDYNKNLISHFYSGKQALSVFESLPSEAPRTLFVLDEQEKLIGTVTDGDIRRGLLKDLSLGDLIISFMFTAFKFLSKKEISVEKVSQLRESGIQLVPILNENGKIDSIINFKKQKSLLPVDAVIMAGGRGERLRPLTDDLPKPLLKIGNKPIIEHNIDLMRTYGISNIHISIKYLGEKIVEYFGDGSSKNLSISYVDETQALGTFGALSLVQEFQHDAILVMNSDLLTNIDLEDLYQTYMHSGADFIVASIPYHVNIPYAVLDLNEENIRAFVEKPNYTYYSNAGIYLFKKSFIDLIPKGSFYNATDFMDELIRRNKKVIHYPLLGYWLDIGKPEDFKKAQEDIKHIKI